MNWKNLQKYKCPKCAKDLSQSIETKLHYCTDINCDFKIGEIKYNDILRGNKTFTRTPTEEENQSQLNEL